ncbi:10864_t:CDS:1, partial [Ambispora gerdemannii]
LSKNNKAHHVNLQKANTIHHTISAQIEIIDLSSSLEEELEKDDKFDGELIDEFVSFRANDLDEENTALKIFKQLFNTKNQEDCGHSVFYTGLAPRTK